jgi:hypothetical protein
MKAPFYIFILAILAACSSPPASQPVAVNLTDNALTPASTQWTSGPIAEFTAVMNHKTHKLVFTPVPKKDQSTGTVTPDSLNAVPDPLGVNGNPASGNADLVTTSCNDPYPAQQTFTCTVNLVSGFTRDVANFYVQISNATLNGITTNSYDATNSDPELDTTNDGALQVSHGLWGYNNTSVNSAAAFPFLGPSGGGFNTGTRTWIFSNPSNQSVVYTILVWATPFWATYTIGNSNGDGTYGNMGYTDACAGGASSTSTSAIAVNLPFDFTLYNTDQTTWYVCPLTGQLASSASHCESGFLAPVNLPSASVQQPVFFPFWDKLKYGAASTDQAPADSSPTAGRVCYQTIGSAPNRMEVIEWRNMDFSNAPDQGSSLDFEAFLYEGTGEIDLYYEEMANAAGDTSGRAGCTQCTIGGQGKDNSGYDNGSTATVGTALFEIGGVGGAGETAVTFLPSP